MFKSLLIATDGSGTRRQGRGVYVELAKAHGSKILVLTSTDPVATGIGAGGFGTFDAGPIIVQLEEDYAEQAKNLLDAARQSSMRLALRRKPCMCRAIARQMPFSKRRKSVASIRSSWGRMAAVVLAGRCSAARPPKCWRARAYRS